jgi:transposase-like protein
VSWPDGKPICPRCGSANVHRLKGRSRRRGQIICNTCLQISTVTVGTVMERSHVPLNKWALAPHMMAKKVISAKQLRRELKLGSYRTAWFLCSRIREAIKRASLMGRRIDGSGKGLTWRVTRPDRAHRAPGTESPCGAAELHLRLPPHPAARRRSRRPWLAVPPTRARIGHSLPASTPCLAHNEKAPGGTGAFPYRDTRAARRLRVLSVPLKLANRTRTGRFGSVLEVSSAATVWPDSDRFQHPAIGRCEILSAQVNEFALKRIPVSLQIIDDTLRVANVPCIKRVDYLGNIRSVCVGYWGILSPVASMEKAKFSFPSRLEK